jgi:hypothetical protein
MLRRLRQEDQEFKASLDHIWRPCLVKLGLIPSTETTTYITWKIDDVSL